MRGGPATTQMTFLEDSNKYIGSTVQQLHTKAKERYIARIQLAVERGHNQVST